MTDYISWRSIDGRIYACVGDDYLNYLQEDNKSFVTSVFKHTVFGSHDKPNKLNNGLYELTGSHRDYYMKGKISSVSDKIRDIIHYNPCFSHYIDNIELASELINKFTLPTDICKYYEHLKRKLQNDYNLSLKYIVNGGDCKLINKSLVDLNMIKECISANKYKTILPLLNMCYLPKYLVLNDEILLLILNPGELVFAHNDDITLFEYLSEYISTLEFESIDQFLSKYKFSHVLPIIKKYIDVLCKIKIAKLVDNNVCSKLFAIINIIKGLSAHDDVIDYYYKSIIGNEKDFISNYTPKYIEDLCLFLEYKNPKIINDLDDKYKELTSNKILPDVEKYIQMEKVTLENMQSKLGKLVCERLDVAEFNDSINELIHMCIDNDEPELVTFIFSVAHKLGYNIFNYYELIINDKLDLRTFIDYKLFNQKYPQQGWYYFKNNNTFEMDPYNLGKFCKIVELSNNNIKHIMNLANDLQIIHIFINAMMTSK